MAEPSGGSQRDIITNATVEVGTLVLALEICARSILLRLGRWEVFIEREAAPAPLAIRRERPGEVLMDVSWLSVTFMDHARFERP